MRENRNDLRRCRSGASPALLFEPFEDGRQLFGQFSTADCPVHFEEPIGVASAHLLFLGSTIVGLILADAIEGFPDVIALGANLLRDDIKVVPSAIGEFLLDLVANRWTARGGDAFRLQYLDHCAE